MLKRGFQFAPGYRLQEFLGRGQFGQVWRATAPGGAATAVKFIDLSGGQGQKEYDGVRRVKQIRHANLMPITAIWLLDGQGQVIEEAPDEANETIDLSVVEAKGQSAVYRAPDVEPSWLVVAMLLGGKSLQQRLRECVNDGLPGIPPKELISYMDESAKGIDFLNSPQHDLGEGPIAIQHSDIKPANIVLIGSSAVVCDFGLARILTRNQVTATSAAGTPAYMAPEAISGKPSRSSDQYSLAVTYYHLRTNALPVNDGSLWEVLDAHRQGKLKLGLVPQAEQEVLRKATSLDWEKRFDSNVDMVEALREALRAEGYTKPTFVPSGGELPAAAKGAETQHVRDDPTATLEVATAEKSTDGSFQTTKPFLEPEESTRRNLAHETLLTHDGISAPATTPSGSFVDAIKGNPKLSAGVGGAALVLVLLGAMALRPPAPPPNPNPVPDEENVVVVGPDEDATETGGSEIPVADPLALANEAATLLDTDEPAAMVKFARALESDPGLLPEKLELSGHKASVTQMLQTADGSQLVTVASDPSPFLWDLARVPHDPTLLEGHEKLVNCLAATSDGQRLLTAGSDYVARVWNLVASNVAASALDLKGHTGNVEAVAWHPSKPIAATASLDKNLGIWEIGLADNDNPNGTIAKKQLIPIQEVVTSLASDPNGEWLAAHSKGEDAFETDDDDILVYKWDSLLGGSPSPIRLGVREARKIAFLSNESEPLLVTGDFGGTVSLYSVSEQKLKTRVPDAHSMNVEAIRVVGVGQRDVIVTASEDGSVHWWKYGGTSESRRRMFCERGIGCVDVSADGRWVAAGANDGSVWLWDTEAEEGKGAIRFVSGADLVESVVIDVNGKWLIAGCSDGVVRLWDLRRAKLMALVSSTPTDAKIDGPTLNINSQITMR